MGNANQFSKTIVRFKQIKNGYGYLIELGPFFVALIAIVGLIISNYNVNKNIELQNELSAINLYDRYFQVSKDNPKFRDYKFTSDKSNWTTDYQDFVRYSAFISESIFIHCQDKPEWSATIKSILYPHLKYFAENEYFDETFNKEFRTFCKNLLVKYKLSNT